MIIFAGFLYPFFVSLKNVQNNKRVQKIYTNITGGFKFYRNDNLHCTDWKIGRVCETVYDRNISQRAIVSGESFRDNESNKNW